MIISNAGLGGTTTANLMKPWPPVPTPPPEVHPIDDTQTGEARRRGCGPCNWRLDGDEAAG
jgi:hypothetical protein